MSIQFQSIGMKSIMYLSLLVAIVAMGISQAENIILPPSAGDFGLQLGQCPLYDDPNHPVMLPDPSDCSRYYVCVKGVPYAAQCPLNRYWSPVTYRCDYKELSNCKNEYPYPDKQDFGIQYGAYPGECTLYYEIKVHRCPDNNQWNAIRQRCEPPQYAGCDASYSPWTPVVPGSGNTGIVPTAPTPPTMPALNPDSYLPIDHVTMCKANILNAYLPYPGDCHKFIHCGPEPTVVICSGQLFWNTRTQSCDISPDGCQLGQ